jgi:hypothetical protein
MSKRAASNDDAPTPKRIRIDDGEYQHDITHIVIHERITGNQAPLADK